MPSPPSPPIATGFDFGTSNCAIAYHDCANPNGHALKLAPLQGENPLAPSAVYAVEREFIGEQVLLTMPDSTQRSSLAESRARTLTIARQKHREAGTDTRDENVFFGQAAIDQYLANPDEGYFIKSPKSFLGATGLPAEGIAFFEDVVTWMMQQITQRAEAALKQPLRKTVIGRPVNFQGANAEHSNQQAVEVLSSAATRAGFTDIEFMIEPVAAGIAFEQTLNRDQRVLVVDIGGGTSDCAMLQMGPGLKNNFDRSGDILGHAGERIGGNDLDIQLAFLKFMPHFGKGGKLKNGLPVPNYPYWLAVAVNDVNLQTEFYSAATLRELQQLQKDCSSVDKIERLIQLRRDKQNYRLVRTAEQSKIDLSSHNNTTADLSYIEPGLTIDTSHTDFEQAAAEVVKRISTLMTEAVNQSSTQPDCVFITGGSARSPVIRQVVNQYFGAIPIHDGDDFGSVAAGLGHWAGLIYR